jgi:glycosyltransferase involved in cell wall biosynthesis
MMSLFKISRFAVIPTHDRPVELTRCLAAIASQVDGIVVIDNASTPPVDGHELYAGLPAGQWTNIRLIRDEEQPPNLSRLWNVGLDSIRKTCENVGVDRWDVAVLNDDAIPPPGWFNAVADAMRRHGAVAACNDPFDRMGPGQVVVHGPEHPPSVLNRLAGWALILRGEWEGARYDEDMRWCFSDDDISYRARLAGGLVYVGGVQAQNTLADTVTWAQFGEQAGRDRAAFVAKHGVQPW